MNCDEKTAEIVRLKQQVRDLCKIFAIQAQLNVVQEYAPEGMIWVCWNDDARGVGDTPEAAILNWIEYAKAIK